jgi:general secretion pathway protein E/type IV pilus assembly protein PilB
MKDIVSKMLDDRLFEAAVADRVRALMTEGKPLDEALLEASGLPEEKVLRYLAAEFQVPYVDLEQAPPAKEFLARFPARILLKHRLLPMEAPGGEVWAVTSRLFGTTGVDELRLFSGQEFRLALAPASEIDRCIKNGLGVGADTLQTLVSDAADAGIQVVQDEEEQGLNLAAGTEDASIIKFVNQVLTEGIDRRATDVHIEPFENELRVRYRIDGMLVEASIPPEVKNFQAEIVSRLKILSRLDIAEKRLPQDGRIKLRIAEREVDVRVSVIPMLHGEAVVLRLLDRSSALLGLEQLGMSAQDCAAFEKVLALPHGIVLVTGPTGSGKTTTLYAALSRINDIKRKIITIEDPVEYHLRGINQIQVSEKAGLTFARGLRAILRHDPNVVLIGEIRDGETAEIAVQASLTGHLVFSTLHTNDAPSAPVRLIDMGIDPYLVASSLEVVLAQRLVRRICPHCKEEFVSPPTLDLRAEFGDVAPHRFYRGAGCRNCQGSGYRGRTCIMELMPVTEGVRAMILRRASGGEIRRQAVKEGMRTLRDDGWRHVIEGHTTVDEVLRVTKDERAEAEATAPSLPPNGNGLEHEAAAVLQRAGGAS